MRSAVRAPEDRAPEAEAAETERTAAAETVMEHVKIVAGATTLAEAATFVDLVADGKVVGAEGAAASDFRAWTLRDRVEYWRLTLKADPEVCRWLEEGYKLSSASARLRKEVALPNHGSLTEEQKAFISEQVLTMERQGSVSRVKMKPRMVLPVGVVPKGKSWRLIHDARVLNRELQDNPFKMDTLREVPELVGEGWYMFTIDLQQGYYHVGLHSDSRKRMGFLWEDAYYQYNVLSFGLKPSAYVFTKVVLQVVKYLRSKGCACLAYIDDLLFAAPSKEAAEEMVQLVLETLKEAGFSVNFEKSDLVPKTEVRWLGVVIDSVARTFTISDQRLKKLELLMRQAVARAAASARERAAIAGAMQSMVLAITPARALTAALYRSIDSALDWDSRFPLDKEVADDLEWWCGNIQSYNGRSRWKGAGAVTLETDSSGYGWGGTLDPLGANHIARGFWQRIEKPKSINWKELTAVERVILSLPERLVRGKRILVKCDNMAAVWYIRKGGGRVCELAIVSRRLWKLLLDLDIDLEVVHIPGVENTRADFWSRLEDLGDWMLAQDVFDLVEATYGPHDVDRFASATNARLERFNSKHWDVGAEAVNGFSQDWREDNNYCNPDFEEIGRTLALIREQGCAATVVAPVWPSKAWYSTLVSMASSWMVLPSARVDLFQPGRSGNSVSVGAPSWEVRAWRIEARPSVI